MSQTVLNRLQRATSSLPGGPAIKRRLQNNATACGMTYWLSTLQDQPGFQIVRYHRVVDRSDPYYETGWSLSVRAELFESQLQLFRRFCAVLSLDEIFDRIDRGRRLPPRCVALTFDDGYRDTATIAWPLLQRYRLPATLYLAVDALERGYLWHDLLRHAIRTTTHGHLTLKTFEEPRVFPLTTDAERLSAVRELDERFRRVREAEKWRLLDDLVWTLLDTPTHDIMIPGLMMRWDEARRLAREGLTIGAHTVTHPILTRLPEDDALDEVTRSQRILQERLQAPIRHFAYPNGQPGDFAVALQQRIEAAGFRSACTAVAGINQPCDDRFLLKRIDGNRSSLRVLVRLLAGTES